MLLETLKTLLSVYGPTGNETQVAEAVKKIVAGKVDNAKVDVMGNLIIEKKGQEGGKKIMFSAHMDHIGMVVTAIEKDGFLRVTNVGGLGTKMTDTRHVVFGNGVHGVAVCQPTKDTPGMAQMFIDIGAEDKEDAEKRVSVGDVCVFANDTVMLGRGFVGDPALAQKAKGGKSADRATLEAFHNDLFEGFAADMKSRRNAMLRLKEIWFYHINLFDDHEKHIKRLRKANDVDEFLAAATAIFRELPLREDVVPGWKK